MKVGISGNGAVTVDANEALKDQQVKEQLRAVKMFREGDGETGMTGGSRKYAVAVTLIEDRAGSINIMTSLQLMNAASEDEARGFASRVAQAENPRHSIFTVIVAEIKDREP